MRNDAALIHVPQPSTEPVDDVHSYRGFGFNKTVDTLSKTVMTNEVRVTVEVLYESGLRKPVVKVPQTSRGGRIPRIYGLPNHQVLQLDPATLPQQVYIALQNFAEAECTTEAIAIAARTEASTSSLYGGSLPLKIAWTPHVETLTFNSVPIHRVNRANRRDATPSFGEQVPHGAMLEAVLMLRQEVSTRDQNSLTGTDALPYACVATPAASKEAWTSASGVGSVKSVLVSRELFQQVEEEKAAKRLADAYEFEQRAIAAAHEAAKQRALLENKNSGMFSCCQAR